MEGIEMTPTQARGVVNKLRIAAGIGPVTTHISPLVQNAGASWSDESTDQGVFIAPRFLKTEGAPLMLAHEVAHLVFRNPSDERDEHEEIEADILGAKLLQKVGYPLPTFEDLVEVYQMAPFPLDRLTNLANILPKESVK
jgi:hypothetical protein